MADPSPEQPDQPASGAAERPPGGDSEELRRRLEEQLRRIRVQDLLLESAVSILNLTARRIGNPDERDLEQGRIGIEAVRAVVELLEPEPREQVREALSQVQVLYAREVKGEPAATGEPASGTEADTAAPGGESGAGGGEGARPKRPSGLWTPPGTG